MKSFEEKMTSKIYTTFLYACFKVSKPKSKKNRRIEWKIFQWCFKNKQTKKYIKWLSWITQFKIEFLPPLNDCRKVLIKMGGSHNRNIWLDSLFLAGINLLWLAKKMPWHGQSRSANIFSDYFGQEFTCWEMNNLLNLPHEATLTIRG